MTARSQRAGVPGGPDRAPRVEPYRIASTGAARLNGHVPDLFQRHPGNPLLSAADWPYPAHTVFNPGATLLASGETLLLVRVEDRRGISHLSAARSSDGVSGWRIDAQPTFSAEPEQYPEELWGVEDARIVRLESLGCFAVTYTAYSRAGPLVALARSEEHTSELQSPYDLVCRL